MSLRPDRPVQLHQRLTSHSKAGSSSSRQESQDETLSVADLAALPRFPAILLDSGAPARIIEAIRR